MEALEPTGSVPHRQACHHPSVHVREVAEDQACNRPVDDGDLSLAVPRSEHEIGVFSGAKKLREMGWVMGKIGVHLEDQVVLPLDGDAEAGEIRGAESELLRPAMEMHPLVPRIAHAL